MNSAPTAEKVTEISGRGVGMDVVRRIVLPHAKSGIFGAILLGFGRAVGETMAMAAVVVP